MRSAVRPALAVSAAALTTLALVAGCTGDEGAPQANGSANPTPRPSISVPLGFPSPLPVVATATAADGQQLEVEINDLRADSNGLTVLRLTVVNIGTQPFKLDTGFSDPNRDPAVGYDFFTCEKGVSGVTVVDVGGKQRYHPLYRTGGDNRHCMNAQWAEHPTGDTIEPDQRRILFAAYVLPDDVGSVTVEIPGFEPVENVPVQR